MQMLLVEVKIGVLFAKLLKAAEFQASYFDYNLIKMTNEFRLFTFSLPFESNVQ